ncbi:MAG: hypothetical protein Phyf2KO_00480 [Phycisphaerales bacterium]
MKQVKAPKFTIDARETARSLQGAFGEALQSVGADPYTPQSIVNLVGLNKNLAWKISRIIQAEDAASVLDLMPGSSGIRIFLKAIDKAGVNNDLLLRAQHAVNAYEQLIQTHSGDRATLEMMGSELDKAGRQHRDEQHRKLLFQGASYVFGAQARVITKIGAAFPSKEPGLMNFATISGFIDFRRIRPEVTWTMAKRDSSNDDGTEMSRARWVPLDPTLPESDSPPLMTEFCSNPIPDLLRVETTREIRYELPPGEIGNTGALTCLVGMVQKDLPMYRTPENTFGTHAARCEVPAELMNVDMFFHRSLSFAYPPETTLHSNVGEYAYSRDGAQLPFNERVQDLGSSAVPPPAPEIPRYRELVEAMFSLIGIPLSDFTGYRVKMNYPAYPTALVMGYPLPSAE